jgi:hypothetical protein
MSSNFVRLSGLAAMLGGLLWALWAGVEQSVGWGDPGSVAYERYELINRLLPLALLPVVVVDGTGIKLPVYLRSNTPVLDPLTRIAWTQPLKDPCHLGKIEPPALP